MSKIANSINASTVGIVGNTSGLSSTSAATQYNVLVGASSTTVGNVAPSATSGIPLVSGGASANPSFTTAVVAGGGTGAASLTAYMPIVGGTTTTAAVQSVATGTAGQVLTYNSSSSLPTWSGAGSMVLIQTQTATNSPTISFTTGITSSYTTYFFVFSGIIPVSNTQSLVMVVSSNAGSTYASTGYTSGMNRSQYSSATINNSNNTNIFSLARNISSSGYAAGSFYCYGVTQAIPIYIMGQSSFNSSEDSNIDIAYFGGSCTLTSVNAFQFSMSSGNISSGKISLYGILQ